MNDISKNLQEFLATEPTERQLRAHAESMDIEMGELLDSMKDLLTIAKEQERIITTARRVALFFGLMFGAQSMVIFIVALAFA